MIAGLNGNYPMGTGGRTSAPDGLKTAFYSFAETIVSFRQWVGRATLFVLAGGAMGACAAENALLTNDKATGNCTEEATAAAAVDESGPFNVGYRSFDVTWEPPGVGERTIKVNVWYPTTDDDGEGTSYVGIFPDNRVLVDARPAEPLSSCGFPLLAHSHGHMGLGGGSAAVMRHFASHGWVAVAPDHTGNLLVDNIDPRPVWMYYVRGLDVARAVDAVRDLPASDSLAGRIAADRYVLTGHSYGAFTAWALAGAAYDVDAIESECANGAFDASGGCNDAQLAAFEAGVRDERIVAAVPMAGTPGVSWFGASGPNEAAVPLLAMTGGEDPVGMAELWDRLDGPDVTWIELAGGCHETFGLGLCDSLDPEEGYRLVNAHALAFARHHLLGDRSDAVTDLVDGADISPLVTFRRKP